MSYTIRSSWPDVVLCGGSPLFLHGANSGGAIYCQVYMREKRCITYGSGGAYAGREGESVITDPCVSKSISQLQSSSLAFSLVKSRTRYGSSMSYGWPDVITCGDNAFWNHGASSVSGQISYYRQIYASEDRVVTFLSASGAANSVSGSNTSPCQGKSISQLYSEGSAFNLVTNTIQNDKSLVYGWPDVILCNYNAYFLHGADSTGAIYVQIYSLQSRSINFNSAKAYSGYEGDSTTASGCIGKSIATLYANNLAFNFVPSNPTSQPTVYPTLRPTTCMPTFAPSQRPSTVSPSVFPTNTETPTFLPTAEPSWLPTLEPFALSWQPTYPPSAYPSSTPTMSLQPSPEPSVTPTTLPSTHPTQPPTFIPSAGPSLYPTVPPSDPPSQYPSLAPSARPSVAPSFSLRPSATPSATLSNVVYVQNGGSAECVGTAGNDVFYLQASTLTFCAGNGGVNTYIFSYQPGVVTYITDFNVAVDRLHLGHAQVYSYASLSVGMDFFSTSVTMSTGQLIVLQGLSSGLSAANFYFATVMPSPVPSCAPSLVPSTLPSMPPTVLPSLSPSDPPSFAPSFAPTSFQSAEWYKTVTPTLSTVANVLLLYVLQRYIVFFILRYWGHKYTVTKERQEALLSNHSDLFVIYMDDNDDDGDQDDQHDSNNKVLKIIDGKMATGAELRCDDGSNSGIPEGLYNKLTAFLLSEGDPDTTDEKQQFAFNLVEECQLRSYLMQYDHIKASTLCGCVPCFSELGWFRGLVYFLCLTQYQDAYDEYCRKELARQIAAGTATASSAWFNTVFYLRPVFWVLDIWGHEVVFMYDHQTHHLLRTASKVGIYLDDADDKVTSEVPRVMAVTHSCIVPIVTTLDESDAASSECVVVVEEALYAKLVTELQTPSAEHSDICQRDKQQLLDTLIAQQLLSRDSLLVGTYTVCQYFSELGWLRGWVYAWCWHRFHEVYVRYNSQLDASQPATNIHTLYALHQQALLAKARKETRQRWMQYVVWMGCLSHIWRRWQTTWRQYVLLHMRHEVKLFLKNTPRLLTKSSQIGLFVQSVDVRHLQQQQQHPSVMLVVVKGSGEVCELPPEVFPDAHAATYRALVDLLLSHPHHASNQKPLLALTPEMHEVLRDVWLQTGFVRPTEISYYCVGISTFLELGRLRGWLYYRALLDEGLLLPPKSVEQTQYSWFQWWQSLRLHKYRTAADTADDDDNNPAAARGNVRRHASYDDDEEAFADGAVTAAAAVEIPTYISSSKVAPLIMEGDDNFPAHGMRGMSENFNTFATKVHPI